MGERVSFVAFLNSIHAALENAWADVEERQQSHYQSYFTTDGLPKTLPIRMPRNAADSDEIELQDVNLPLILFMQYSALQISRFCMEFPIKAWGYNPDLPATEQDFELDFGDMNDDDGQLIKLKILFTGFKPGTHSHDAIVSIEPLENSVMKASQ